MPKEKKSAPTAKKPQTKASAKPAKKVEVKKAKKTEKKDIKQKAKQAAPKVEAAKKPVITKKTTVLAKKELSKKVEEKPKSKEKPEKKLSASDHKKEEKKKQAPSKDTKKHVSMESFYKKEIKNEIQDFSKESDTCFHCLEPSKCRRRVFSEKAWVALLIWKEISLETVEKPLCDHCYKDLRDILIDRTDDIEVIMTQQEEVAKIKKQMHQVA